MHARCHPSVEHRADEIARPSKSAQLALTAREDAGERERLLVRARLSHF